MRRLQSFPAPVASISGLQDQLQQTDWTVEDGELCFLRPTRQLFEFRKGVTSPAANGITTVQAALPGVVGQWALLADSDQNVVYFSPQGGGADDWPALNTLMAGVAGQKAIVFTPGTYTCNTTGVVPSNTTLIMNSGVKIVSTMTAPGSQTNCVFRAVGVYVVTTTTLTASGILADTKLSVASVVAPAIAVGSHIVVSDLTGRLAVQIYKVLSRSGAGNLDLTVDRPLRDAWPSATTTVAVVTSRPSDIYIYGEGAIITGTGDRCVEFGALLRGAVTGLHVTAETGTFSDCAFAFDTGSRLCLFEDCTAVGAGANNTHAFLIESCEDTKMSRCTGTSWAYAHEIVDSWDCSIDDSVANSGSYGIVILNSSNCSVRRGVVYACGYGVDVSVGSTGTVVSDTRAVGSGIGGFTVENSATIKDTVFVSCSAISCLNGFVALVACVGTRLIGCRCQDNTSTDVNATASILIDDFVSRGCAYSSLYLSGAAGTGAKVTNFDIAMKTSGGAVNALVLGGGAASVYSFARGKITIPIASSNAFQMTAASSLLVLEDMVGAGSAAGTAGIYPSAAGCVRLGDHVDFSTFATPLPVATILLSRGTVALNGVTPVAYSFPDIKTGDSVKLTRMTAGGTAQSALPPTFTVTPGTGISVVSATVNANDVFQVEIR